MENYEYIGDLGSGSYGFVWKCLQRSTGRVVAVKGFKLAHKDKKFLDQAIREVRMLRAAGDHPNVVQLLEAFRSSSGRVYMVFEFVERCLSAELHKRFTCGLPAGQTRLVLWQLLAAVAHLHSKKILHRDIKPGNLLMTTDGVVKLCDFGFARTTRVEPYRADRFSSYVVTRWYRSPEMLVSDLYCAASDIWSLGCTFAELATGRPLFPGNSSLDQLWRIMRCQGPLPHSQAERFAAAASAAGLPEPPPPPPRGKSLQQRLPELDPRLLDIVQACLRLDPVQRPTAAQVMQMPYFWDVPKAIAGTPLELLYNEFGGVGAMGVASGRNPRPPPAAPPCQSSPGSTPAGFSSAPVRSVATSVLAQGELVASPKARRGAAAAGELSGSCGSGAAGPVRPRPPSVLLSAVAASLLGELPPPPGGTSGTVPLVSPRAAHPPLLGPDSGSVAAATVAPGRSVIDVGGGAGLGSAPRSPASPPRDGAGAAPAAACGDESGQPELPHAHAQAHMQHQRDQLDEEEQQALRRRRATATAVPATAPGGAAARVPEVGRGKRPNGRAASAGGAVGAGVQVGQGARGLPGEEHEKALLSTDSILAAAEDGGACGGDAHGTSAAVAEQEPLRGGQRCAGVIDDSCYAPHSKAAGLDGPQSKGADVDRSGAGVVVGKNSDFTDGASDPVSVPGSNAAAGAGRNSGSRSSRAAAAPSPGREPRVGLGPGIGLLDEDDLMSSGDGHISDDDELMEYFATKPRLTPGRGGAAGTDMLPKASSMRGRAASPPSAAAAASSAASDHGAAALRRGPSEGMHAGVQAVHHGLYGSGSRQHTATGITTVGRVGNRRVAALVLGTASFGRHGVAAGAAASSQQGSSPQSAKRATVGNFLASPNVSDPLPVLTSPAAVPQPPPPTAAAIPAPPIVAAALLPSPPVVPPPLAPPPLRASTTLGTTTATVSVEATAEPLSHADGGAGGLPPLAGHHVTHSTTIGFSLHPPLQSRASLPAPGYAVTASGLPPAVLMSAGHQRRAISRQGSTVFNQLMYDALPEIGTPGGAPEAPVGTPPRRRAVMSGFTPCRAAAARAAAAGMPPAAAMAAAMGEAMQSTVELSVAFSPIHVGRGNEDLLSPDADGAPHDGGADSGAAADLRMGPPGAGAAAAAAAAARRYAQQQSHRRHMSLLLSDAERPPYAHVASSAASGVGVPPYPGAGYRPHPYPYSGQRPHGHAATSDTGMLLGSSAPNTTFYRGPPRGRAAATASGAPNAAALSGDAASASGPAGAVPIPGGAGGRLPLAIGIAHPPTGGTGYSPAATPSSRGHMYPTPLTPAIRSRLASGNMVRVSEASSASAAQARYALAADDPHSADLDGLPFGNLGFSPASGHAPPPPHHLLQQPHPHATQVQQQQQQQQQQGLSYTQSVPPPPPPAVRGRVGRWASGLIDSLPEDREVVHVNGVWNSGAGGGTGQGTSGADGAIQALAVYSNEWASAAPDGDGVAAAGGMASDMRPTFSSETGGLYGPPQLVSPRPGSGHWMAAADGQGSRHGGEGSRHAPGEGSRHAPGEGSRHGPGGPLLSRISPRLRSGRSQPKLDYGTPGSSASPTSPAGPRSGTAAGGASGSASGRWLPPVVADGSLPSVPHSQRAPDAVAAAAPGAASSGGAAAERDARGSKGGSAESGSARSSGSKWPRAKALLGGRFISSIVRKFKEQSADK